MGLPRPGRTDSAQVTRAGRLLQAPPSPHRPLPGVPLVFLRERGLGAWTPGFVALWSGLLLSPIAPDPAALLPGAPGEGEEEWPPGWRAGRAGRAAFLGIVWGKCIVRVARSRPLASGGCLLPPPKCCLWGEGHGLGPRLWAGLGTFRVTLPLAGSYAHAADWETEAQSEGCHSGRAKIPSGALDLSPWSPPCLTSEARMWGGLDSWLGHSPIEPLWWGPVAPWWAGGSGETGSRNT